MAELTLTGANFIGSRESRSGGRGFAAVSRLTDTDLTPEFFSATDSEVAAACLSAEAAFATYRSVSAESRAAFLEEIATQIEALGDSLLERAHEESSLPVAGLVGERARTCGQLRMFAKLLREGSWVDARIDHGDPARPTVPKPDLRRMLVPLGPVAVFGASNFPLAFSVAGGDTASALAAGCPVVVKAHPAHPGTSEFVVRAVIEAARKTEMPEGVISMLHGGADVGQTLVQRPEIYAVGFTGSLAAGRALFNLAAARPRPIPVYAEMGSVNPVFVLPGAIADRMAAIASAYTESVTARVGQFCTNPGLLIGLEGAEFDVLLAEIVGHLSGQTGKQMLTREICARYQSAVAKRAKSLDPLFDGSANDNLAHPALFKSTAKEFLEHPEWAEEVFGPTGFAITCTSIAEMATLARSLEGQLTSALHASDADRETVVELLPILTKIAGRVIYNGFPTGVEVNPSMQHGGPYPATTDSRTTSVGTAAILRFARPVAFQNTPDDLLPPELQEANPREIWRRVDGVLTR